MLPSIFLLLVLAATRFSYADEQIRLLGDFSLSPDGSTIAFSWLQDVWMVDSAGGAATRLTTHPGNDTSPCYSPDGDTLAFTSNRAGGTQVFLMPASGGSVTQVTHHMGGYSLQEFTPDGNHLLVGAFRDHFWRPSARFFLVDHNERRADKLLFDAYGRDGSLGPKGKQLLFTREGVSWWRKGYTGSQASQIWGANLESGEFTCYLEDDRGFRSPLFKPDGSGFYYVGQQDGTFNLWSYDFASKQRTQLTEYQDDGVVSPCLSRDGRVIVFRRLFDLYRYDVESGNPPQRIEIVNSGEPQVPQFLRRSLDRAGDATFSDDGLEMAFVAGGDVWVMDTELKEPRQVTDTPYEEREPLFHPDGDRLLYVSDSGGQTDIWIAQRADSDRYWWQNDEFNQQKLTNDAAVEFELRFSPTQDHLSYIRGTHLWVRDAEGKNPQQITDSWSDPSYDWSPDGKWIVYAESDNDFNSDIWVRPIDGHRPPFNLSVHPDNDRSPAWSPDGKIIAFTGRRQGDETDLHYVYLRKDDAEEDSRDRRLAKALEKMKKARKEKSPAKKPTKEANEQPKKPDPAAPKADPKADPKKSADTPPSGDATDGQKSKGEKKGDKKEDAKDAPKVTIDFDGIHERIRTISNADEFERSPFWLSDDTLAVTTSVDGKRGIYSVKFPDELRLKLLTSSSFSPRHPIGEKKKRQWAGISSNRPALLDSKGKITNYSFQVRQEVAHSDRYRAGFDTAWRLMRDNFYDERLNNRNWSEVRRKYVDMAAAAPDASTFQTVVRMMLGELNGSHLGFTASREAPPTGAVPAWVEDTAHLGLRFDPNFNGPGWKVRDVLPNGPTSEKDSRVEAGEVILSVDGTAVDPALDPTLVMNGPIDRDIELLVADEEGAERTVAVRPMSARRARGLLYEHWVRGNRKRVDELSDGRLGYLHIRGMNWSSFLKFEMELYRVGYGKEGLVIDVRGNGGGFTTDHLLTALTQPSHAITVPRGGGQGYPQDRRVYATWNKPVVVLCDQNSFSNAEIFSHAIKNLGRGQLVGVPTAGGVISTGGSSVMDLGFLRMPFRGWYVEATGEDMELNGAVPHFIIWPKPGELPRGIDRQLQKGVEVLQADVEQWKAQERPELRKASQRRARL